MHGAFSYGRLLALAAAFAVFGGTLPARADGLDMVTSFPSGTSKLVVADYVDGDTTIGLLAITPAEGKGISFAFDRDEWAAMIGLWRKASDTPSGPWKVAGSMAETGTSDPSVLIVYAGTVFSFVIAQPSRSAVISLTRGDGPNFEAALNRVLSHITP
jgi:hypothetical protein